MLKYFVNLQKVLVMERKLHVIKKLFVFIAICLLSISYAQVTDGFSTWTKRSYGDYIVNVSSGSWTLTNSAVIKSASNIPSLNGAVELAKVNTSSLSDKNGGTLTTPIILKGGANSIDVSLLRRDTTLNGYFAQVNVQKSTDGINWVSLQTLTVDSSTPTKFNIPVNDFGDNLQFKIISLSRVNSSLISEVVVNHSFILESDNAAV